MRTGKREWLRMRGRGVHHYYVQTLWGFVKKRRRATVHFLRVQEESEDELDEGKAARAALAGGGLLRHVHRPDVSHRCAELLRDRDARWLWHLPACLGSVLGNAWGVWTYKTRRGEKNLVAKLKPKQTLK